MARLVKEWMKAKKGICSSDCECLTITWWRCYAEEHLCNCGDWGSTPPVPPTPVVHVDTISAPFTDNVLLILWEWTQVWFNFTPTNATEINSDITVASSDDSIVSASLASWWADWVAYVGIATNWVGTANVTYSLGNTSYSIAVTVEPEIYIETITAPSDDNVTLTEWWDIATVTFDYTPTNANRFTNLTVSSSNTDVASGWISTYSSWTASLSIQSAAEGTATITYAIDWTSYDIAVTVNALP